MPEPVKRPTGKKIYEQICEIIDSHIRSVYITPHMIKQYIPNEDIRELKSQIHDVLVEGKEK